MIFYYVFVYNFIVSEQTSDKLIYLFVIITLQEYKYLSVFGELRMTKSKEALDALDKRILRLLQEDSRLSYRKMAEIIGVSVSTVSERVNRMLKGGIIKGFTVLYDPEDMGLDSSIAVFVRVKPGVDAQRVGEEISQLSRVCYVYNITGEFAIFAIARFSSKGEANTLLNEISAISGVESINSAWILNTIKESARKIQCD